MTLNKKTILYKTLARALSMKRQHKSEGEARLLDWLEESAKQVQDARIHRDTLGNLHIDTRVAATNRTLFVAHVDTVHHEAGPNKIRKTDTHWHADGAPLGADDGAGVAVLMHLLHAGIKGYFVFTVGEECGGIGATHLYTHDYALLSEFDRAIAFDRRGIDSVITHQAYGRCCSDLFAQALAYELCADMTLMYSPDDTGVYTDTAEFVTVIPECTNISVGYYNEHSDREYVDIQHLVALAKRCALIAWDNLPVDRNPTVSEGLYDNIGMDMASDGWWANYDWNTGKATSVNSSDFKRYHHLVDDQEWLREDLRDAIYDAMAGSTEWLIELMCESVWPDEPDQVAHLIDRNKLTYEVLTQALQDSNVYDPDVLMANVFDLAYRG